MSQNWSDIIVTPGSHADARLPAALGQSRPHLRPDALAVNLAQLAEVAPAPWNGLLQREPALVLAQILAFRLDDEVLRYDLAEETGPQAAAAEVKALADRLDNWLKRINVQWPDAFSDVLTTLDLQMALTDRTQALAKATVHRISQTARRMGFMPATQVDAILQARDIRTGLRAAHRQMVHAIGALQPVADTAFTSRLKSGDIDPALGLIIAELTAGGVVDERLNRFTTRHTDFYYGEMIGQRRRGAEPERALLHLPSGPVPRFLPAGTGLIARQKDGKKLRFQTETDIPVTPAKVAATAALTYEMDHQVSLYTTLGAITGVRAAYEPAATQPLNRAMLTAPALGEVAMGLDVASDMFVLAEGARKIEVRFIMRRATDLPAASRPGGPAPDSDPDPDIALELRSDPALLKALGFDSLNAGITLLTAAVHARAIASDCTPSMDLIYEVIGERILTTAPLRLLLGRIVTLGLMENHPWPTGAYWAMLEKKITASAAALTGQNGHAPAVDAGAIVEAFARHNGRFIYSPADMFTKLLGDAFAVTLTGAEGTLPASFAQVLPLPEDAAQPGFLLRLEYGADRPAITPPAKSKAPVLSLRWDSRARVCPVSFFERYAIEDVDITVNVQGLRNLAGFSDAGAVSPGQAFHPFGARPLEGGTFTIAAPEMARKPVSAVDLDMIWADLPALPGGFATHYADYPRPYEPPEPMVRMDYLSGDGWKPVVEAPVPLIPTEPYDGKLLPHRHLTGPVIGGGAPASGTVSDKLPKARAQLRAGAVRLTVTGGGDFGQSHYPLALSRAMRPRLVPVGTRPLPPAPYIPRLDRITLGYTAAATMTLGAPASARPGDRVTQITPFGQRELFPHPVQRNMGLFPPRLGLGTLYIQLAGAGALRQLGILLDVADSGHLRLVPPPVPLVWHYLTAEGWAGLPPTAIQSDTTDGLLKSGVITIDLPDDAATPTGEMPGGGVWVAVSAPEEGFDTLPILTHVRTNGVWASSREEHDPDADHDREWRFEVAIPGMAAPLETSRRAPPTPPESRERYLARISERLRHRQRAVTPYDVERLVLQNFPEVWRVKCLPHLTRQTPVPQPGTATVVVVRHPPAGGAQAPLGEERLFDAGTLDRIRDFLQRHGAEQAKFDVVNPAFDRLHVRAAVRFAPFRDDGALAAKLQRHLSDMLSVWTAASDLSRFGWSLDVPMLKVRIAALDDVLGVTDFSVLHFVADDQGYYQLADTAQADQRGPLGPVILPSRPWALPLSTRDHAISSVERIRTIPATQSGIGRLRVGDMLIVGQEVPQ